MSSRRVVGAAGKFEYVVEIESVSLREDEPLYAAHLVTVINQTTGLELGTRPPVVETFAGTPDDAMARLAALADEILADR